MIEEQLFQKHFVGRDGFIWWIGQVVDQTKWQDNINGRRVENTDAIPGFGERYKVRIMGYHTFDPNALSDDELPWATVMYPVTAGSGNAGASTSAQLRQGSFVFGFFIDGEDAQQPVIMGVLGYNAQTSLEKKVPKIGFLPFSGYTVDDKVPVTNIQTSNEKKKAVQVKPPNKTETPITGTIDSVQGATSGQKDKASEQQKFDGKQQTPMSKLTRCGRNDIKGISADIEKMILLVENLTKLSGDFSSELTGRVDKIQRRIKNAVDDAIVFVTSKIKNIVEAVRKSIVEKINDTVKGSFFLFLPNQRPAVKEAHTKVLDGLSCAINKIIQALLKLVSEALKNLLNKALNAPVCLAESVASNIVGSVAGFISGIINSILQPINALLSTVGAAANLAGQILSIIKKIFGLFSCEEELSCPTLDQWSIWDGPGDNRGPSVDIESIFNQAQSIGQSAAQAATDLGGAFNANNLDVGGISFGLGSPLNECNIGPIQCGAPNVSIFGASGSNALGNAIIGTAGEVLGVDIVSSGTGFMGEPAISIFDSCGTGDGASALPIMSGSQEDPNGMSVEKVVILDPGTNYLTGPNGSEGGSGRVWKKPGQTYKRDKDGNYFPPVDPGTPIELNPGDVVKVPAPVITELVEVGIIPPDVEYIIPEGIGNPIIITAPEPVITTERLLELPELNNILTLNRQEREVILDNLPQITDEQKETLLNLPNTVPTYPVILELDEIFVKDPGFNYNENDTIVMEPSNGAILTPIVRNGAIVAINIEKTASGFDTRPRIFVDSDTGFNAELVPVFKVKEVDVNDPVPLGTKVISVVDCVGKITKS